MIAIIDYGMGNLGSVQNACTFLEIPAKIVQTPDQLEGMKGIILPGQGAFGDCMLNLRSAGFETPLKEWIAADRPLLGICVGLQVLYEGSSESPDVTGLGILPGTLGCFEPTLERKVPQMGWNSCHIKGDSPLFAEMPDPAWFYLVHSYYAPIGDPAITSATATYGLEYTAAISRGRLHATQFHPEKSQMAGKQVLRNFLSIVETA